MPKLSVCIEMFWKDEKPEDKIRLSAKAGYKTAEFWRWENKDLDAIKAALDETGMNLATFCMASDKPLVAPFAADSLVDGLRKGSAAAKSLGVDRLILTTGNERTGESFGVTRRTVIRNLKAMAPVLDELDMMLVIEPLNTIRDHLGYWLTKMSDAADIMQEVGSPRVTILMDAYHQQITEGNLIDTLTEYAPLIGHYHCAGVPGRQNLVGGELDYRAIFTAIDATGYDAYVGLEFSPKADAETALEEAKGLVEE